MSRKQLLTVSMVALGILGGASDHVRAQQSAPSTPVDQLNGDDAARCAQLKGKQLAGAAIEKVQFSPQGTPEGFGTKSSASLCRVEARISPVPDSSIKIVILLPSKWNGKLAGIGGAGVEGGFTIAPVMLRRALAAGFAGVATDAGHDTSEVPEWALGHPDKIVDYGHRANHLGAVVGKAVVAEYYRASVKRSYFHGCSNGGRDALMLAQRYPKDYDVIGAGAAAYNITAVFSSHGWINQVLHRPGVDLTKAKLNMVHDAFVGKCDALDGVKDGLIERPPLCRFDPAVLECKPGQGGDSCLSKADLHALKTLYRGPHLKTGQQAMPGLIPSSEYDWPNWISAFEGSATKLYRYMVYNNPKWDSATFNLDRDYASAKKTVAATLDANDTDLRPFIRGGGRLLMYHGWDDTAVPAGNTLNYYSKVQRILGREGADRTRLFMVPGMGHCYSGKGPDFVDYFAELNRWDESGIAPERIIASKFDNPGGVLGLPAKVIRTRPLCAWPKAARYKGTGSIDDAESFECR